MNNILRCGVLLVVLITAGCSKQSEITTKSGKYFVQSLGNNINRNDLEQSVAIKSDNTNNSSHYRYGSLNAKLAGSIVSTKITRSVKDDISILATPALFSDMIVTLNSNGQLIKSKISPNGTSSKIWEKNLNSSSCSDLSVGANDGIITATCGSNIIKGFDFENGKELWQVEVNSPIASKPLFSKDHAVFFAKNDAVYSIDYKSGQLQWYVPNTTPNNNKSLSSATPFLVDNYVIQQTNDDQVRAINVLNGQVEWIVTIGDTYKNVKGKEFLNHYGSIAYDEYNKTFYLNNSSGAIVKLKFGSNKADWIIPAVVSKPIWLADSIILAVDDLGSVIALSKVDGKLIWSNNILETILTRKENKDIFGKSKPYNQVSLTPPMFIDGKVIIISSNNKLIAISPENGKVLDIKHFKKNIFGQPFVHNGRVYVMTNNGRQIIQL